MRASVERRLEAVRAELAAIGRRQATQADEAYHAAVRRLARAAARVPIVRRGRAEPFSTCLGCGRVDGQPCRKGCWVYDLDMALQDLRDAEKARGI